MGGGYEDLYSFKVILMTQFLTLHPLPPPSPPSQPFGTLSYFTDLAYPYAPDFSQ